MGVGGFGEEGLVERGEGVVIWIVGLGVVALLGRCDWVIIFGIAFGNHRHLKQISIKLCRARMQMCLVCFLCAMLYVVEGALGMASDGTWIQRFIRDNAT